MALEIGKPTELGLIIKTNGVGEIKNLELLLEFFRTHPDCRFEVRARTIPSTDKKNLYARYFAGVVTPTRYLLMQIGEIKTKQQTHQWLKSLNPELSENGQSISLKDCCENKLLNHIHFCLQYVAENFGVALDM